MAHKVKLGVSGCAKNCIMSRALTDIGFVPTTACGSARYDAYVGGRLGLNPFLGVKMADALREEQCLRLVQNFFEMMNNVLNVGNSLKNVSSGFYLPKVLCSNVNVIGN